VKLTRIDKRTVREILNVYGIHNATVAVYEDITDDQLIDAIMKTGYIYLPYTPQQDRHAQRRRPEKGEG